MKSTIQGVTRALSVCAVLFSTTGILSAQPNITRAETAYMTPADYSTLPRSSTYWTFDASGRPTGAPLPYNPFPSTVPVYYLGDPGQYLIGTTSNDWAALATERPATQPATTRSSMASRASFSMATSLPDPYGDLPLADDPPAVGTFWSLSITNWPPMPYNYCPSCGIYLLPDGSFLVDDRGQPEPGPMFAKQFPPANTNLYSTNLWLHLDWLTNGTLGVTAFNTAPGELYNILSKTALQSPSWTIEKQIVGASNQTWTSFQLDTQSRSALFLWATNTDTALASGYAAGSLWLELVGIHSDSPILRVHGTSPDYSVQVMSKTNLADSWTPYGPGIWDTNGQGWFDLPLQMGAGTNSVYFWAYSPDYSSDGSGLPDWWKLHYFGTINVSPWDDPGMDGWNNYEKFLYGMDPRFFSTPAAPRNANVSLNQATLTALVTWEASPGPVLGYTVTRTDPDTSQTTNFNVGLATQLVDPAYPPYTNVSGDMAWYAIQARYLLGNSSPANVAPNPYSQAPQGYTAPGPSNAVLLVLTRIPNGASAVRLSEFVWNSNYVNQFVASVDLPLSAVTNGFFVLPANLTQFSIYGSRLFAQGLWPDGTAGQGGGVGGTSYYPAFYDGREHLAQNLAFMLRAARVNGPLNFQIAGRSAVSPTNYAFAGYITGGPTGSSLADGDAPGPSRLFVDNYLYRNFVPNLADAYAGAPYTFEAFGFWLYNELNLNWLIYSFQQPTNSDPIPAMLSPSDTHWIAPVPAWDVVTNIGMTATSGVFIVNSRVTNWFGLPLTSVLRCDANVNGFTNFGPGDSTPANADETSFFPNFAAPSFQTAGYTIGAIDWANYNDQFQGFWPDFLDPSYSNAPLPIVATLGDWQSVVSYARQTILNGDRTKPAYLGQYFENAFHMDDSGAVTGQSAGALSPYGDFTPTSVGDAALVTMPNWGTSQRGTNIVHVIALCTDLNRDGVIDSNIGGPDFTSGATPFRFWVNDNHDTGEDGGNGIPGLIGLSGDGENYVSLNNFVPAYKVRGVRDLVDFFPVYVDIGCLLKALPSTSALTFKLSNRSSALRFAYTDLTPTNFQSYLTDANVARSLAYADLFTATWDGVTLTTNFLDKIRDEGKGIILVEAASATAWPLTLSVLQGSNQLAESSLQLRITGVEQMFRHKNLTREVWPGTLEGFADRLSAQDVPNEPDTNDKNFVFLHGYNTSPNEARGTFADVFKRMFWAGSHAKFYGVTWRGNESALAEGLTPNYHTNVANAFLTAPKLANFLGTLTNGPTVLAAHSLGNMVALDSLSEYNARADKYFMIDAAVAREAIDGTMPWDTNMIQIEWRPYANRLWASEWCRLFGATDGRSTLTWSNRLANLLATNVYNFYSSGEDVLREYTNNIPPDSIYTSGEALVGYLKGANVFVWTWQELMKGRSAANGVLGSWHGGWKFNDDIYGTTVGGVQFHMSPSIAANLPDAQLRTNTFFGLYGPGYTADDALPGASGASFAQANRNRLLADTIPALTLPIGANHVDALAPDGQPDRNLNMQTSFQNGWPSDRMRKSETNNWHHSDFHQVAYTFTFPLFDKFVTLGNMK